MLKKILLLCLLSIILCGCTKSTNKTVISFSSWGSISEVAIIKKIISEYEKNNPNIKINFIHIPQNYYPKIHLLFASNTEPDVIFINNLNLPTYESKLENLNNYINPEEYYKQSIDGLSYKGEILAFPRDISNLVLYVNTDILPLPKESWTIEDLLSSAQKITTQNRYGISFENGIYWNLPYINYFGGRIIDNTGKSIVNSPESKKGIDFYINLRDKYKVAPQKNNVGSSTLAQMFLDKKIGMYLSGRWMFPKIKEKASFNWAVINFPYGENGVPCDTSGWAISKNSKHKKEAIEFAKYLANEENSKYFSETKLIIPARINVANKTISDEHNERVFLKIAEKSTTTPVCKKYNKIVDKINREINY